MSENIILKNNPKIEFQLLDNGFKLIDGQTERNTNFYSYHDMQSIELNKVWYPRLATWLRIITWILNGVPYFPDPESYKKANLVINFRETKLKIWLTDLKMANKAKTLKAMLTKNKPPHNKSS